VSQGKAVVLARGVGSRMRERADVPLDPEQAAAADAGAKAMMPVGGHVSRPFLDYLLSTLADAGYDAACLVVAPDHEAIRRYYTEVAPPRRLAVSFAVQPEPRGTADAVLAAAAWTGGDHFLVVNGDNLYPRSALAGLRALDGAGTALFPRAVLIERGNIPPERVRAFALCTVDADGFLASIVEKPAVDDPSGRALVSMNCWRMPPEVHDACRQVAPSVRGELELADAVTRLLRDAHVRFRVLVSEEGVLDLSRRSDVAAVSRALAGMTIQP
jgi:glucose-1-phosphate thymidylyltransferase